jgi:predicted DNA-binding transcriptional regulator AlpA
MPEELLSPQDLAAICGVPLATVYRWNHFGGGPVPLHVGRYVRYRPADVDAWLEEQKVRS